MLKNGKFIKEKPIKIGAHYVPPPQRIYTEEDGFVQRVLMGYRFPNTRKIRVGVGAYLLIAYFAFIGMFVLANVLAGILFG